MRLDRYHGNPILTPREGSDWESLVTCNPGAWYDEDDKLVKMLYRAAGNDPEHRIHLGMAVSEDGYNFRRVSDRPVFSPSVDGFDAGCVEDPRVVRMGDWYYITYASRPFPPGQYWMPGHQGFEQTQLPPECPLALRTNNTATGLLVTRDFRSFIRAGRMTNPMVDDRDVILFPEKIGGKFAMIHRPMNWVGPRYGTTNPAMWISFSDDLLYWPESRLLATAQFEWEGGKIGGNTPPIRTDAGWLTLYHAVGEDKRYRLGAMLLDLDEPWRVLYRSRDWLLQPEEYYELEGYYPGVVFPCGKVVLGGTLFVYYGGADKYVGLATCSLSELLEYLKSCPST